MSNAEVKRLFQDKVNSIDLSKMLGDILFKEILDGYTYRDFITYGNTRWFPIKEIKDAK